MFVGLKKNPSQHMNRPKDHSTSENCVSCYTGKSDRDLFCHAGYHYHSICGKCVKRLTQIVVNNMTVVSFSGIGGKLVLTVCPTREMLVARVLEGGL